jgi:predicted Zn-dependent protease
MENDHHQHGQLFRNDIKKHQFSDRTAAKYGLALTLIDQKKLDEAHEILTKLLKTDPANLFYLDSKTDLLIAQKNTKAALKLLKEHYQTQSYLNYRRFRKMSESRS